MSEARSTDSELKRCGICGEYFPRNRKFFYDWQHFNGSWYLKSYCKKCDNEKRMKLRKA